MKKNLFFWILALMICANVGCADNANLEPENAQIEKREQLRENLSHEVTQAMARENLEKILPDLKLPSTRGGDSKLPPITSVYTRGKAAIETRAGEEIEPYFHIFNFGDNEGFAIMSGDDRVEPLLALTFEGELTPETEIDNPGFEIAYSRMEDYYVQQVSSRAIEIPGTDIPPKDSIPETIIIDSTYYYTMPLGYCPVRWGQGFPYNMYCELDDTLVPTGCVTTAVAQLMSIYKYPDHYSDAHGAACDFNWNEMNQYTHHNTSLVENPHDKYEQIAELMKQLGKSINLSVIYGKESSHAFAENIPRTLRNFRYTYGGDLISYETDTVVRELANGFPVLIGGEREGENGQRKGHRWLGHGLMKLISTYKIYRFPQGWITLDPPFETYYILCNWGWDGNANGYYLSNVFNVTNGAVYPDPIYPNDKKINYNYKYNINVVMNIRK